MKRERTGLDGSSSPWSGGGSADDRAPERQDPEHRAAIAAGREQIRRGDIASVEEVEAAFRRFDP